MNPEGIKPRTALILNMLVWGLGYIYAGKFFKGTMTFFLFAFVWGFYLIEVIFAGFSLSLMLEILGGYFLSGLWFGYDAYNVAVREKYKQW